MPTCKNFQISEYALLVSFMRVKIDKEFEVAKRLSNRFLGKQKSLSYYTCYGQYDLVEFLKVDSFEEMYNMPFDKDIVDCGFSLFYSWEGISHPFINEWVGKYPVLVFVLLKIRPSLEEKTILNIESNLINFIKMTFDNDVNFFASMGRSDILMLIRGKSFEKILPIISELRQKITITNVIEDLSNISCNPELPIFIDSTTFPLIAHPALKGQEGYDEFEGRVLPMINVICNPGFEGIITDKRLPSCSGVYNFYGNQDVTMVWNNPIELSQFAKELTDFRKSMSEIGDIRNTSTTFLGIEKIDSNSLPKRDFLKVHEFKLELAPGTKDMLKKSGSLNSLVKSRLIEFLGRLNSYYTQQHLKLSFEDMTSIHLSINSALDELTTRIPEYQISRINSYISEIIDLCNNALFQRYSGLESIFTACNHLPYPFLRGINGFIAAATCIPCFIFSAIIPDSPLKQTWPGFVLFGLSYSYQIYGGKILSYPASSLQKPIEDWWGITHEIAHAIYYTLDFYHARLPQNIKQHLNKIALTKYAILIDIEEIYANWFDFKYIFRGDKKHYFPTIWRSWLRWKIVWQHKTQYLFRSFLIYLTTDMENVKKVQNKGYPELIDFVELKLLEMENLIKSKVPHFNEFLNEFVKETDSQYIKDYTYCFHEIQVLLFFLEKKYFDKDMYSRLNPHYPEEVLRKHISNLEEGVIITEYLPNPIRLLHELYNRYNASGKNVPIKTTAATVLTLWFKYINEYRRKEL